MNNASGDKNNYNTVLITPEYNSNLESKSSDELAVYNSNVPTNDSESKDNKFCCCCYSKDLLIEFDGKIKCKIIFYSVIHIIISAIFLSAYYYNYKILLINCVHIFVEYYVYFLLSEINVLDISLLFLVLFSYL